MRTSRILDDRSDQMSGSTATLECGSQTTAGNNSRPTEPLLVFGVVLCPVPGLTCNVYSRSSDQLLCQVTFLSYVWTAEVHGKSFQAGDLVVHIDGEDKLTQARALGVYPFSAVEADFDNSPLYCKPADD